MTDPQQYLRSAGAMLAGDEALGRAAVEGGWWPRACACLIRLAVETAITTYWQATNPAVAAHASGRTRLLLLRRRLPHEVVRQTAYVWATLSRATHHHCYETMPTAPELRSLLATATSVIKTLTTPPD